MLKKSANVSLEEAINESKNYLNDEDKEAFLSLSKMLGMTDIDGQVSQIEITQSYIDRQIKLAEEEKNKNQKLYQKLGVIIGISIVIILF